MLKNFGINVADKMVLALMQEASKAGIRLVISNQSNSPLTTGNGFFHSLNLRFITKQTLVRN